MHELEASNWRLRVVANARDARRELHRHDFLVGLFVIWPDDKKTLCSELARVVAEAGGIRWIGGLDRGQPAHDAFLALAAEHLHDFVSLPLDGMRLAVVAGHAYGMAELDRQFLSRQQVGSEGGYDMLGSSPPMRALFKSIAHAATNAMPVVIHGETGSGRQAAARAIHAESNRAKGPFVVVRCATLPTESLYPGRNSSLDDQATGEADQKDRELEAELVRAFSDSAGGTLFLDGVQDLTAHAQARLLGLIDKVVGSPGHVNDSSTPWIDAPLRIVCSSDADLDSYVHKGAFRHDLFYRLNVLSLRVPSLRERGDDVLGLASHFLGIFKERHSTRAMGFNKDALDMLSLHDWPGNLLELRNRVHKAALACEGSYIAPKHLGLEKRGPQRKRMTLQQVREAAERRAIDSAVKRNRRNLTRTAEELAISRMTLYRLLEKHGIEVER
jgi:DNA-binding NtrC family response regulator